MAKYNHLDWIRLKDRTWPDNTLTKPPILCSVDLRDGNQALAIPMSVEKKLKMFRLMVEIGFKEIEVGFPAASQIDFDFVRELIENNLVPDDVYLQILTQAREHLIIRSLESLQGAKNAIIHLYNSTSPMQRRITFKMSKEEIKDLAVQGTELIKKYIPQYLPDTRIKFEYSPESFSDTETDYALEVCQAVMQAWQPTRESAIILNLPETVQWASPNVHADQIEWFIRHLAEPEKVIVSLHTHNDRGTGVASAELALLAGAGRVEGTLFGNGERTGNLDIVTLCLNMFSDGLDMGVDLRDLPRIRRVYEDCTGMDVHPRHPYAGDLVFTAFSGSHQDAIKKGIELRNEKHDPATPWEVPYLTLDPRDIGRSYEAIIRINSQSGKGGVSYILQYKYGIQIPKNMQPEFGKIINNHADALGRELSPSEIYDFFCKTYLQNDAPMKLIDFTTSIGSNKITTCDSHIELNGESYHITGEGNGPIDAFMHTLKEKDFKQLQIIDFYEQALKTGSNAEAISYIKLQIENKKYWGAGIDTSITLAGIKALVSCINRSMSG